MPLKAGFSKNKRNNLLAKDRKSQFKVSKFNPIVPVTTVSRRSLQLLK